jgi:putative tryptophan/tyrosine transport system substrate-binding protein
MRRREFMTLVGGAATWPLTALTQQSRSFRAGYLTFVPGQDSTIIMQRLQELGYRQGGNLEFTYRSFSLLALRELKAAAKETAQPIQVFEARSADQVLDCVNAAAKAGAAGLLTLEDALLTSTRRQIAERAITTRLPIVYGSRAFPEAGGLISYGVDRRHMYRRAAEYVDMILKGKTPSELPVEQPTKFELVINLKAAKAIALDMPDKLLALADEVIE